MTNKLEEMSSVEQIDGGVDVHVRGDVRKGTIEKMVASCSTGNEACCGPEFFEHVSNIDVGGHDGNVTIHVKGSVTGKMIEQNLSECDCYNKQLDAENAENNND